MSKYEYTFSQWGMNFDDCEEDKYDLREYFRSGRAKKTYKKILEYTCENGGIPCSDNKNTRSKGLNAEDINAKIQEIVGERLDIASGNPLTKKEEVFGEFKIDSPAQKCNTTTKQRGMVYHDEKIKELIDMQSKYTCFLTDDNFRITEDTLSGFKFFFLYLSKMGKQGYDIIKNFTRGGMGIGSDYIFVVLRDYAGMCNILTQIKLKAMREYSKEEAEGVCDDIAYSMFDKFLVVQKKMLDTIMAYKDYLYLYVDNMIVTETAMNTNVMKYVGFDKQYVEAARRFNDKIDDTNMDLTLVKKRL